MFKTVLVSVVAVLALGFCDATFKNNTTEKTKDAYVEDDHDVLICPHKPVEIISEFPVEEQFLSTEKWELDSKSSFLDIEQTADGIELRLSAEAEESEPAALTRSWKAKDKISLEFFDVISVPQGAFFLNTEEYKIIPVMESENHFCPVCGQEKDEGFLWVLLGVLFVFTLCSPLILSQNLGKQ